MVVVALRVQLRVYMITPAEWSECNMATAAPTYRSAEEADHSRFAQWAPVAKQMASALVITTLLLMGVTTLFVAPAAAQDDGDDSDDADFCDNDIMVWVRNATGFLTVAGPSVGILNAGWNMLKASGSNKSNSIKEAKGNIKTALMFGFGLGALAVISGLITTWGPVSACSF